MTATPETLHKFVAFCQQHITGDEKGQAQLFLDSFFRDFGHESALEAWEISQQKVKKSCTYFAYLIWKSRILIKMKKLRKNCLYLF